MLLHTINGMVLHSCRLCCKNIEKKNETN